MRKKLKNIILLIVVIIIVFVVFNAGDSPKPLRVGSSDGSLTLTILDSALPAGTELNDLSIESVQSLDVPLTLGNEPAVQWYTLEPNGLQFTTPAQFTLSVPVAEGRIPVIYHISQDSFDRVDNVLTEIDAINQVATLTGEISHFSGFYISFDSFQYLLDVPAQVPLGQSFEATGVISKQADAQRVVVASERAARNNQVMKSLLDGLKSDLGIVGGLQNDVEIGDVTISDPWSITGWFTASDQLSPTEIKDAPATQQVTGSISTTRTLTCLIGGKAQLTYHADLSYTQNYTSKTNVVRLVDATGPKTSNIFVTRTVECVEDMDAIDMSGFTTPEEEFLESERRMDERNRVY